MECILHSQVCKARSDYAPKCKNTFTADTDAFFQQYGVGDLLKLRYYHIGNICG